MILKIQVFKIFHKINFLNKIQIKPLRNKNLNRIIKIKLPNWKTLKINPMNENYP